MLACVQTLLMYGGVNPRPPPPPHLNNPCLHELPCNFDLQAWVFRLALKRTCGHYKNLVPDPDLETRGARSSRPLDKRGGGGVGETAVSINFISALRASVWSKNKGGLGPPRALPPPSPGSATGISLSRKH